MRSITTVPHLIRGAIVALVFMIAAGLLFGSASLSPQPQTAEAAFLSEVTKLLASDAQSNDRFGAHVAIDGNTAIVSAHLEDAGNCCTGDFGAAYVFQRDNGGTNNWSEVKKLTASDPRKDDLFGSSVAISGDTILVGAALHERHPAYNNSGAAYVFQRNEGGTDNWGEVKELTVASSSAGDSFGSGVAVNADTIVVGACCEDSAGNNAGAAYILNRDEGGADNWGEVKKLIASDGEAGDQFGNAVSISGDTVIVGAHLEATGGVWAGAAYIFQRDEGGEGNWGEVTKLTASAARLRDNFGESVALSGDTAVVGAYFSGPSGNAAGTAYVFQRDQGGASNWGEVKKLTASDAQIDDRFGWSVALSGDTAVVGAAGSWDGYEGAGAYVFQRDHGGADSWDQVAKLTASDVEAFDSFGIGVAVDGNTAFIGADREDEGGAFAGAAYVFELPSAKIADGDTDGDTIANSVDMDDDNDGCSDLQEMGKDETLGGLRDPHNMWDFYDVLGPGGGPPDGIIDLPNDILAVIQHFSPAGTPPYDVTFDRGPSSGPDPWNMTAPDGVIDLPNDILGVINQFGHSCQ